MMSQAKDKAVEGAKATDLAVREHPYAAIGIALGVGSIIGFLIKPTGCPAAAIEAGMNDTAISLERCATAFRICARRLLTIGENRIVLLTVEVQEERDRLLHAFVSTLGVAAFALLAGMTFTAGVVVLAWAYSPVGVLLGLALLYAGLRGLAVATSEADLARWAGLHGLARSDCARIAPRSRTRSHESPHAPEAAAGRRERKAQSRAAGPRRRAARRRRPFPQRSRHLIFQPALMRTLAGGWSRGSTFAAGSRLTRRRSARGGSHYAGADLAIALWQSVPLARTASAAALEPRIRSAALSTPRRRTPHAQMVPRSSSSSPSSPQYSASAAWRIDMAGIAKILFVIFIIIFVVTGLMHLMGSGRRRPARLM